MRRTRFFSCLALWETGSGSYHSRDGVLRPQLGLGVHVQQQGGDGGVEDEVVHCVLHLLRPWLLSHVRERHAADEDLRPRQRSSRQTGCVTVPRSTTWIRRWKRLPTCRRASGGGAGGEEAMCLSAAGASSATYPSFFRKEEEEDF